MSDWGGERKRWTFGVPRAKNAKLRLRPAHDPPPRADRHRRLRAREWLDVLEPVGRGRDRKAIIEADLVDCMIALPGQLFYSTQIPACLWFLACDKKTKGFRDRRGEVLFIAARSMGRRWTAPTASRPTRTSRSGFIVPSGIATDDTTKEYFSTLVGEKRLASLYDFQSGPGFFAEVGHARFKFCLLTIADGSERADLVFFVRDVSDIEDPSRHFTLSPADFAMLNPNTRTCPTFRSRRDAELNLAIYRRTGVLWRESDHDGNPWGLRFMAMFHMTNDSGLFRTRAELASAGWALQGNRFVKDGQVMLPLYEAKMVHHFDHRFGDYADQRAGSENTSLPDVPLTRLQDVHYQPLPRYWIAAAEVEARLAGVWDRGWLLGWRDITNATNVRTGIASLIPRAAVGNKLPLLITAAAPPLVAYLYSCLCSFALDYAARQKVGGTTLNFYLVKHFPVIAPAVYSADAPWHRGQTVRDWILPRVLKLAYTAWDLQPFAEDCGDDGPPFLWDPERRFQLRAELDAAFFHLYGLSRDEVSYILDTFPIVRRHDESAFGDYRTKRVILEVYDALARATASGTPYVSPLGPPRRST